VSRKRVATGAISEQERSLPVVLGPFWRLRDLPAVAE
jgi:hypothetical protein